MVPTGTGFGGVGPTIVPFTGGAIKVAEKDALFTMMIAGLLWVLMVGVML